MPCQTLGKPRKKTRRKSTDEQVHASCRRARIKDDELRSRQCDFPKDYGPKSTIERQTANARATNDFKARLVLDCSVIMRGSVTLDKYRNNVGVLYNYTSYQVGSRKETLSK